MSDAAFLAICLTFTALGYIMAKVLDKCRDIRDRQEHHRQQVAAYLRERRTFISIQERAELDDLRDYAGRRNA